MLNKKQIGILQKLAGEARLTHIELDVPYEEMEALAQLGKYGLVNRKIGPARDRSEDVWFLTAEAEDLLEEKAQLATRGQWVGIPGTTTRVMQVGKIGCLVKTIETWGSADDGSYGEALAMAFVPGATLAHFGVER